MLWILRSPTSGTVADYIINFMGTIKYHLERGDVYLVFDSYIGNSTKQMMRSSRSGNDASREHQPSLLPSKKVTLNVVHNKVQLIDLICHYLMNNKQDNQPKLVITGRYLHIVKSMGHLHSPERRSENKPRRSRCCCYCCRLLFMISSFVRSLCHHRTSPLYNCVRSK